VYYKIYTCGCKKCIQNYIYKDQISHCPRVLSTMAKTSILLEVNEINTLEKLGSEPNGSKVHFVTLKVDYSTLNLHLLCLTNSSIVAVLNKK
jgi:hypothetical protein